MPMVPQFQGGVPQVQDNGSVGAAIVRLPESNFDYAKVMEKALTPVNEFANSFTKTMEVERARMIKAESDDAERQVIGAINDSLMGENGYLKQQGKNASDTYEKSMEGLRTSVDKIIGGMSPQARQAIESRLNDRIVSAVTKANQHRLVQQQQYQVGSAKAQNEFYVDDYAIHAGDAEYQERTMASLMLNIDYLAGLQGWGEEQTKAMKLQMSSLAKAKSYLYMASTNPVEAFAAFRLEKGGLDVDVALKLENQLFSAARDSLALSLAGSYEYGKQYQQSDFSDSHNTKLTDEEEKAFQKWAKESGREGDVYDYDLRGAWKEMQQGSMSEDARGHLGDKYKKPNHPTFSNQSVYSTAADKGGAWSVEDGKDVFTVQVDSDSEAEFLEKYFSKVEPNAVLRVTVKQKADWTSNPLALTGDPFIDSLPEDQRYQIATRAKTLFATQKKEAQQELKLAVEDNLSQVGELGQADKFTQDQFVSAWGWKEGVKLYEQYSLSYETNKSVYEMRGMSEASIAELLEDNKPKAGDDGFAIKQKRYEVLQKAATQISKLRKDDPVGYMSQNHIGGVAPLNFDNKQALIQQLRVRQYGADDMAKDYGVAPVLFSKSEAQAITTRLDAMNAQEQSAFLGTLYEAVGVNGAPLIVDQLKSGKVNYAIAMAGMGTVGKDGISLGTKYLIGREAITTKRIAMDGEAETGIQATIRNAIGAKYSSNPRDSVEGVFSNKQAYESTVESAVAVYAFNALAGSHDIDGAIEQSVGEIYVRNNKKVVLPRGMDDDDFELKVENIAKSFKDPIYVGAFDKKEPKDIPALFAAAKLQTEHVLDGGGMAYSLTYLGQPLLDKKGKKIFIEVK